ncbi:hypothetical protein FDG94_gp052 [Pseudomonas phage SM1]|uniref:ParB-like N-terminal domain-containing protein n=3 Tax=root TaxID=1 RepID=A0A0U2SAK5_9CAUD|nr:hypothetical protein FDG94_gp052 [Pseudomonas phage SM1]UGC97102.1 tail fiber protein [Pseudomonas phage BHU-1]UGV19939.1 tail fiber protein [Pseudomonas phage Pa BHU-15]UIW13621.1 tail fiber protein [Pseudomonas phage Pa BHU-17]UVN14093.1 hypothetical protein FBPa45_0091 [Pseudomonas phage vB_PaeS_FBPa45]WDS62519.1 tail fiber protein [Pseudomonas phage UF_RH6]HBO9768474.1 ParB N-terminal domain-containing protein [Pseudomonas aeruginosa]
MALRQRRTRVSAADKLTSITVVNVPTENHSPDIKNPRKADPARLGLLRLSIVKLGFLMPIFAREQDGTLLSGHQRQRVCLEAGIPTMPTVYVSLTEQEMMGINILFNRVTNDFSAFDTGSTGVARINMKQTLEALESLPDCDFSNFYANACKNEPIKVFAAGCVDQYDKKAIVTAGAFVRMGVKIPLVVSESGEVVNGVHRLFAAIEKGLDQWPVVRIPDRIAEVAKIVLNYLSMDFHIDEDFKDLLRGGAFRRVSNNRGLVPKSFRFWANGERSLLDRDSYSTEFWLRFREIHGNSILDFGAGLCRVAPYLRTKGFEAMDFEPYRVDPVLNEAEPSPDYSRSMAKQFLSAIADPRHKFDSIFMSAVMNSIPFPEDRLKVLVIVHALCRLDTSVYGTCRDISDFSYEYGGVRNGNYFVMDGEPGIRLGDINSRPKIQKFMTQDEARSYFDRFWNKVEFWEGGNVFFFRLSAPKAPNLKALGQSLDFEFGDLPFLDGSRMGLAKEARAAFAKRLGRAIP